MKPELDYRAACTNSWDTLLLRIGLLKQTHCCPISTPNAFPMNGQLTIRNRLVYVGLGKSTSLDCHRNFGPENFGPPDRNFRWKNGPPGPIFSVKMIRAWKFGPSHANWKDSQ